MTFCDHCSEREGRRLAFIFLGDPNKEAFVKKLLEHSAELMDKKRLVNEEDAHGIAEELGESVLEEGRAIWEVESIMKHVVSSAKKGELFKEGNTWHWLSGLKRQQGKKLCDLMAESIERYPAREDIQKVLHPEEPPQEESTTQ
ncbi:MAG: hypothetical protein ACE5KH_06150 [Candidatus Geothermarchaeales archaeon]